MVQVWSKTGSNKGHFTPEAEAVSRPYLASHMRRVTQLSQVALSPNASQPVEVWSKSGSNEGHFTLEAEAVSRPYLDSYFSGVTQTSYFALPLHALLPGQVWSKSVSNKGTLFQRPKEIVPISLRISPG
jgi:hypothetical protein